jgi:predicted enzyme related to lactoylglutathione lyase
MEQTGNFYRQAFGWKVETLEAMNYTTFEAQPGPGGGFTDLAMEQVEVGDVVLYLHTEDIDEKLAQIEALGGKRLVGKTEIPETGWYALFQDPTGNRLGLFTPLEA